MSAQLPIAPEDLRRFLDDGAIERLDTYFNRGTFTGGRFESFGGGGDNPAVADRFTSDDIVAVAMLSVRIPGRAALALTEDCDPDVADLLAEMPIDKDLWEVDEDVVSPDSPADQLFRRLDRIPGIGWVTAGKLLARKRPRLIPVYDRVVKAALNRPANAGWWRPLRSVLATNPDLVESLQRLRQEAGLSEEISLLRVLDVSIWMKAHGQPEPVPEAES